METQVSEARPGAPGFVVSVGFDVGCGLVGKVELAEDEAVEVADGQDLGALVVGEVDGESLFCAEDDFYESSVHGCG